MSAEVQPLQGSSDVKKRSVLPGQMWIVGRINAVNRNSNGCFTTVSSAARDEYSMPGLHEVQSKNSLGRPGDDVNVLVEAGGYRKNGRNQQTGETFSIIRNTLRVVDE